MSVFLGKYQMLETLGAGSQGKVKKALNMENGQMVAIKLIERSTCPERELQNVSREIEALSRLDHHNIVGLYEYNLEAEYPYRSGSRPVIALVIELATGGELFDFMMFTGCFPENIARTYFQQLISGLNHCHEQGIAHRDLKPENLLLDQNFNLKITDFGFAALFRSNDGGESLLRTECGTKGYMAPEVISSIHYDGRKSDVWSCGVILFIMLAGFPPFQMASSSDWWFQRIRSGDYKMFWAAHERYTQFPERAKDLLNKIFVVNPEARFSVQDILLHPWMQEAPLDPDSLTADLERRQEEVKIQKRAEAEKRRSDGCDMEYDPVRETYRSAGDSEKELPPPPVLERNDAVKRYTSFHTQFSPATIVDRISQALSAMHARYTFDEETYKIKAEVTTQSGPVRISGHVFTESDGLYYIEFQRRRGNMLDFQNVYRSLFDHVQDIACFPEIA